MNAENEQNEKELSGIEKRMKNLKPFGKAETLTPEERERQKEIQRNGSIATAEKKRLKRTLKDATLATLEKGVSKEVAKKFIGDNLDLIDVDDIDLQALAIAGLLKSAIEGNAKAFEVLRDTSGQTVKQSVEVDTNLLMTEADRTLIQNVLNRSKKNG